MEEKRKLLNPQSKKKQNTSMFNQHTRCMKASAYNLHTQADEIYLNCMHETIAHAMTFQNVTR